MGFAMSKLFLTETSLRLMRVRTETVQEAVLRPWTNRAMVKEHYYCAPAIRCVGP